MLYVKSSLVHDIIINCRTEAKVVRAFGTRPLATRRRDKGGREKRVDLIRELASKPSPASVERLMHLGPIRRDTFLQFQTGVSVMSAGDQEELTQSICELIDSRWKAACQARSDHDRNYHTVRQATVFLTALHKYISDTDQKALAALCRGVLGARCLQMAAATESLVCSLSGVVEGREDVNQLRDLARSYVHVALDAPGWRRREFKLSRQYLGGKYGTRDSWLRHMTSGLSAYGELAHDAPRLLEYFYNRPKHNYEWWEPTLFSFFKESLLNIGAWELAEKRLEESSTGLS